MAATKYGPLRGFVLRRCPMRVALHGYLRDRLLDHIVQDWPLGCDPSRIEEVVRARMTVRLRERYGSVLAVFLLSTVANLIIRLVIEWWFAHEQNRVLMAGWATEAQKGL